jgi:hypothetical protein
MFWQRVTVEQGTESQTATGAVVYDWAPPGAEFQDMEARVLPLATTEKPQGWATPEEDAYEIHLRHGGWEVRPLMRVRVGSEVYDVRNVVEPPPFGTPSTVLQCVKETP